MLAEVHQQTKNLNCQTAYSGMLITIIPGPDNTLKKRARQLLMDEIAKHSQPPMPEATLLPQKIDPFNYMSLADSKPTDNEYLVTKTTLDISFLILTKIL